MQNRRSGVRAQCRPARHGRVGAAQLGPLIGLRGQRQNRHSTAADPSSNTRCHQVCRRRHRIPAPPIVGPDRRLPRCSRDGPSCTFAAGDSHRTQELMDRQQDHRAGIETSEHSAPLVVRAHVRIARESPRGRFYSSQVLGRWGYRDALSGHSNRRGVGGPAGVAHSNGIARLGCWRAARPSSSAQRHDLQQLVPLLSRTRTDTDGF